MGNTGIYTRTIVVAIILAGTTGISLSQNNIDSGLVAHFPFDGNFRDSSSGGNHGINFGATFSEDRFGRADHALFFDGVDDYITTNNNFVYDSAVSIAVFVKPVNLSPSFNNITRQSPTPANILLAFQNTYYISLGIHTSTGYTELDIPIKPSDYLDGNWHCIVGTYDGSNMKLYTDGSLIGEAPKSGKITPPDNGVPFSIGSMNNEREFYHGYMDDLRFYHRALTKEEALLFCNNNENVREVEITHQVCRGDSVFLMGEFWKNDTILSELIKKPNGDSIIVHNLSFNISSSSMDIYRKICPGDSVFLEGKFQASPGIYTDVYKGGNGCDSQVISHVSFFELQPPNLGNDTSICPEEPFYLKAGNYVRYLWNDNSVNPSLRVYHSGLYWVEVEDENRCTGRDSINIAVCLPGLYIPNSFSPNGDGKNDFFKAVGINISDFELSIYNRWGELIFRTEKVDYGWDGTFNDNESPVDIYIYHLEYQGYDEAGTKQIKHLSGIVHLIR